MPGYSALPWVGIDETPIPSQTVTATGASTTMPNYGPAQTIRAQLAVTAASGTTPTLDVTIQDTLDGGTNWNTIGTFTQMTAAGAQVINITTPFSDNLRVRWVVGGVAPSFTFSVAWAVQI